LKGQPEDHRPDSNSSYSHTISSTFTAEKGRNWRTQFSALKVTLQALPGRKKSQQLEVQSDETNPSELHIHTAKVGMVGPWHPQGSRRTQPVQSVYG